MWDSISRVKLSFRIEVRVGTEEENANRLDDSFFFHCHALSVAATARAIENRNEMGFEKSILVRPRNRRALETEKNYDIIEK